MKSMERLKENTAEVIKGAWVTLGIPFDFPLIKEKVEGIIDVEALIMGTLLVMDQDRMATDLPAWLRRFSSLVNHQKLKTMYNDLSKERRALILENIGKAPSVGAPKPFRNIFDLMVKDLQGRLAELKLGVR